MESASGQYVFDCGKVSAVGTGSGWLICEVHMCKVCMAKAGLWRNFLVF